MYVYLCVNKQVSFKQLKTFAAARRAAAPCCRGAGRAATDRYLLPAGPTAANPPHAAAASEWDRLTDRQRTPYRYIRGAIKKFCNFIP